VRARQRRTSRTNLSDSLAFNSILSFHLFLIIPTYIYSKVEDRSRPPIKFQVLHERAMIVRFFCVHPIPIHST